MSVRLLTLPSRNSKVIKAQNALKKDVTPWLLIGALLVAIYAAMGLVIATSLSAEIHYEDGVGILYQRTIPAVALIVFGCLLARQRPQDIWTWALMAIVILIYIPQGNFNMSMYIFPNSVLQPTVAMVGLLATGRIVEYLHAKYVVNYNEIEMSKGAWSIYLITIVASYTMNSSFVFEIVYAIFGTQGPT